jgi:hypothetical protein
MENNTDNVLIPYKGHISKDNIEFDLMEMPNKLRQLLYKFVKIHKRKLR